MLIRGGSEPPGPDGEQEGHVDPDRSSRAAARRIVEEVLAEHAARASSHDGAPPVAMPARPDTPSWRAARRIVEETLAEHTARPAVPSLLDLDAVADLEELDAEIVLDLDGPPPPPASVRRAPPRESEPTGTEDPVEDAPFDVEPVAADPVAAEPVAAEPVAADPDDVEPVAADPDDVEPVAADPDDVDPEDGELAETEPEGAAAPDATVSTAPASPSDTSERDAAPLGPVDEDVLRAALSDRLFASLPEPDPDHRPADGVLDGDAVSSNGRLDAPQVEPVADGPPALPVSRQLPLDPDDPTVIAARIVADVLADREQARVAGAAEPDAPGPIGAHDADQDTAGTPGTLVVEAEAIQAAPLVDAHQGDDEQPGGDEAAWWTPSVDESQDPDGSSRPDRRPEPVLAISEPPQDVPDPNEGVDRLWSESRPEPGPADELVDDPYGAVTTEDEFGEWPDPIAPPRRTGRWLVTTVLGAVLLAFLLPLAVGALRDLVSFS
jgi:hypothetical protein